MSLIFFMRYLLYILFFSFSSSAQNFELTYHLTSYKEPQFEFEFTQEMEQELKKELASFRRFSKNFTLFVLANEQDYFIKIDDVLTIDNKNPYTKSVNLYYLGLKSNVLFINNELYYHNDTDSFITKAIPSETIDWEIDSKKHLVNGYDCYSAVLIDKEKKYGLLASDLKVWFTDEVGIVGGPTLFGKLPGLIVAVENNFVRFDLKKIIKTKKKLPSVKEFVKNKNVLSHQKVIEHFKKLDEELMKE